MILSYITDDSLTFIDNIDRLDFALDDNGEPTGYIKYIRNAKTYQVNGRDGAYLLNDRGQKVQVLFDLNI